MNLNQCNFIGRLGDSPESRFTQSGKKVVSFRIACTEKYSDKEHTEWISITAWEKLGDICESYLKKGSLVFIMGKYQTSEWKDKDNNKRYSVAIVAREMKMLSPKDQPEQRNYSESGGHIPDAQDGQGVPF